MVLLRNPRFSPPDSGIPLATRKGTSIPNEQGKSHQPRLLDLFVEKYRRELPSAVPQVIDATYNCAGLVFACRRTGVRPQDMRWILEEDEYQLLGSDEQPNIGDIVLYAHSGELTHAGIIFEYKMTPDSAETRVLSKWGWAGAEYLHDLNRVPVEYGEPVEFWRHIKHYGAR